MRQHRPIGITVFALIGTSCGICLLFLSIVYLIFKSCFVVFHGVYPYSVYITCFIFFALGSCFLISSLALLKRKLWARRLFLSAVFLGMAVEVWLFVQKMIPDMRFEASPIGLEDILEFSVVLIYTLLILWYFSRKNVRDFLTSRDVSVTESRQ